MKKFVEQFGALGQGDRLAIKWNMTNTNLTGGFEAFKEVKRKRFLKPEELQRLSESLVAEPNRC